ncbi:hypothetical protein GBAR_LOCUS8608 [Geodia barretti]|uniref:Uncharacterized protein n=1 Tax=Geodia barretti TaxID=519541 RepID=A0AA35RM32_GEOBA|nr:hypothetical protein GBAR_LOCUS8608 [Geodia barretti]
MSLVAYGDSSSDSEAEEGPEPPADAAKSDVRKLLGLLPPPKGSKPSGKHPVRISIPTVKSGKDSDDEEEESTQVKRVKIVSGGDSALEQVL